MTMKVRITLTLEVDEAAWADNYGFEGASSVRQDVQEYVRNLVSQSNDALTLSD